MYDSISGKSVLVVGASRGMGRGIAETYLENGASVVVAARSMEDLEAVASEHADCHAVECDLRDQGSVKRAVAKATDELGCIDVVVNSAGVLTRGPLHEASESDLELVVDVNLLGALRLSKTALPKLVDTSGSLVHITSEAGSRGIAGLPAYCASKGGVNTLVKQLAVEYGNEGVTVNAIAPGTTKTSMNEEVRNKDPSWVEERSEDVPLGRLCSVGEVVDVALFLGSDAADYITGDVIHIDGGSSAT
ncbi:SDR family NAD(P)-dependent oxidoreductase [Halarchaeum salinum]|uniref:3-oxoacyl-[acyl-carrier-protein] reductase n=1 Tax=Halarchaeum salinum TaxID=489912 RepID=A0AAV3SAB9_9EURY